jgi:hypothetical protein
LEKWWTPDIEVSLEKVNNDVYRVKFDGSNKVLPVGGVLPNNDGYCIGLHYADWTGMYKGDNPSFIAGNTFAPNNNIPVYNTNGALIAGNEPAFPLPAGEIDLDIYARDESYGSPNQSTPRIYLVNTGTQTISDFTIVYYFTTEDGKEPILSEYYLPNSSNIEYTRVRNNVYKVTLSFQDLSVEPGETFPDNSGLSFGLNYSDWSNWDITNDFSNTQSGSFIKTNRIAILNSDGKSIYGISPENNPRYFPLSAVLRSIPNEVLSYTNDYYREYMNPFPNDSAVIPSDIFNNIYESVSSRYPSLDFDTLSENTNSLQPIFDDFPNLTQAEVVSGLTDIIAYYEACKVYETVNEVRNYFNSDSSGSNSLNKVQGMAATSDFYDDYFNTNEEEFWYLLGNWGCIGCAQTAVKRTQNITKEQYPNQGNILNEVDAFRHILWNALLVRECADKFSKVSDAVNFAKGLTDAHEYGDKKPKHDLRDIPMDFHNNRIGLEYIKSKAGTRTSKNYWFVVWIYKTVVTTPSERTIVDDVKSIAEAGKTFANVSELSCLRDYAVWFGPFKGCPNTSGNVSYQTYVTKRPVGVSWLWADQRWLNWESDGASSGKGDGYQIEAIKIQVENVPEGMSVEYRAHTQSGGWHDWVQAGQVAGNVDKWRRLEAIQIRLVNALPGYGITYRAKVKNKGWLPWVSDGSTAGTTGESRRMERIEIKLVKPSI